MAGENAVQPGEGTGARVKTPATRKPLSPRHHVYIEGVLAGKTGKQAAIDAGFSAASASSRALELNSHPEVIKALEARKARLRKATGYDVEAAFKELDDTISRATEVKQFNAVVKAIEAKSRMVGILDKPNALIGIDISAVLAEARGRRLRPLPDVQDATVIDVAAAKGLLGASVDIFG